MKFFSRRWVHPANLNPNGTLFGGELLRWVDEEAGMYAVLQLDSPLVVTAYMSEIKFVSSPRQGDIIEIGMEATHFGRTSLTFRAVVRNIKTHEQVITIEKIVMVRVDEEGRATPHGKTMEDYLAKNLTSDGLDECSCEVID